MSNHSLYQAKLDYFSTRQLFEGTLRREPATTLFD